MQFKFFALVFFKFKQKMSKTKQFRCKKNFLTSFKWNWMSNRLIEFWTAASPRGLRRRFFNTFFNVSFVRIIWVQPAPWSRCFVLGQDALLWISLLGGFEQAPNSVDKKLTKSTGTLDHWKLLSRCVFLQSQTSHCNELRICNLCGSSNI